MYFWSVPPFVTYNFIVIHIHKKLRDVTVKNEITLMEFKHRAQELQSDILYIQSFRLSYETLSLLLLKSNKKTKKKSIKKTNGCEVY